MAENTLLEYYKRVVKECLTECDGVCHLYNDGQCECVDANVLDHLKELKAYQDAEEQGLLFKLPCKEVYEKSGDTVWLIYDYEVTECIHCGAGFGADGIITISLAADDKIFPYRTPDPEHDLDPTDWCTNYTGVTPNDFGKTVFLTREEAEAALQTMNGE